MGNQIKYYLPSIFLVLLGALFFAAPGFAVFVTVTGCFVLAMIYAFFVYKILGVQQGSFHTRADDWQGAQDFTQSGEPSFRNVTVLIAKRTKTMTDF